MNYESNVSGYSKSFPTVFNYSKNDILRDVEGKDYIDFFSGAGALNYGHNNPVFKEEIFRFLESDAPVHFLDMDSEMKLGFLRKFNDCILTPRGLDYKIQFPSPSGTNAVEAAIKLARKVTKRTNVVAFTNSYHGMTATSLAASGSQELKHYCIPSQDVTFFPFDKYMGESVDTVDFLERMIIPQGSGQSLPAAIILETIQAEGGINIASKQWLRKLSSFAQKHEIILIIDDIQVGCGRTGSFFSFEEAQIHPDIVLLSKSISGFGLPLSLLLIRPDLDVWAPGEHNGTFRANNLSLCTAAKALDYWKDERFAEEVKGKAKMIEEKLLLLKESFPAIVDVRGKGLIWGVEFENGQTASELSKKLFEDGLIIETCGNLGQVIKLLPPLTIDLENLKLGLKKIKNQIEILMYPESNGSYMLNDA